MAAQIRERADRLQLAIVSPEFARAMDAADELKEFRGRFAIPGKADPESPGPEPLYLCANSLGLMPLRAREYLFEETGKWGNVGVEGYFSGVRPWATVDAERAVPLMAAVVGAAPSEVVNMNSLTVNLHLLMLAFYKPTSTRYKILVEDGLFCSDSHAVRSQLALHGLDSSGDALVKIRPRADTQCLRTEDVVEEIRAHGAAVALVLFSGIQYRTGQMFDMEAITAAGHGVGATVGWDLAHAVGNVALRLHDWGVDFAAWCTYKYLNSGPGAVGGAFVHERHHHTDRRAAGLNGLDGWWGQSFTDKFAMGEEHRPIAGAQGFQLSTVPMLSTMCLLASLEIFREATMERIVAKQRLLTGYLEALLRREQLQNQIEILTPSDVNARGSQLSLQFASTYSAREVHERLQARGVICDVREPGVMRVGPAPLYNTFSDVLRFVKIVTQVLGSFVGNGEVYRKA